MKKKITGIVLLVLVIGIGYYFLHRDSGINRGFSEKQKAEFKNKIKSLAEDMESQKKSTAEISLNAGIKAKITSSSSTLTKEVNIEKIVWTRDYLKKYKGKISDEWLIKLNILIKAMDEKNGNDFFKIMIDVTANVDMLAGPISDMCNDSKINKKFKEFLVTLLAENTKNEKKRENALIKSTAKGLDESVREVAVKALHFFNRPSEKSKERLMEIARDPNDKQRNMAVSFLCRYPDPEVAKLLEKIIKENKDDQNLLFATVYSMGGQKQNANQLYPILENIYNSKDDYTGEIRKYALQSMIELDAKRCSPIVEKLMPNRFVIEKLIWADYVSPKVEDYLLAILVGEKPGDRELAACALSTINKKAPKKLWKRFCTSALEKGLVGGKELYNEKIASRVRQAFEKLPPGSKQKAYEMAILFAAYRDKKAIPLLEKMIDSINENAFYKKGLIIYLKVIKEDNK